MMHSRIIVLVLAVFMSLSQAAEARETAAEKMKRLQALKNDPNKKRRIEDMLKRSNFRRGKQPPTEFSTEEVREFIAEKNLRKRKQKGIFRKKQVTLSSILFPGASPVDYTEDDSIPILIDAVDSKKTQLPFDYYKLPVCRPANPDLKRKRKNLGEKLMGHGISKSAPYEFTVLKDSSCTEICSVAFDKRTRHRMINLIKRQYAVELSLDGLPAYMYDMNKMAFRGYPLGSKLVNEATGSVQYFFHNHLQFIVEYQDSPETDGYRVVGFRVKPVSIDHDKKQFTKTCSSEPVVNDSKSLLRLDGRGDEVATLTYTYEVSWRKSDIEWADRWDVYLRGRPDDSLAHHMSIINSFMVVIFLGTVLSIILIKALRRDIAVYNELAGDMNDEEEESGWKLIHGDVFRPPSTMPMALAVMVGTGAQIGVSLILSLLLSLTNFLNPMKKGQALSDILLLFVMSGTVSGYISARLFKFCGGKNWKLNTLYTASAFPGACMVIFVVLNTFLAFYGTAKTVSFWTIFLVFFLWTCVSVPLVCVGSFFGFKLDPISVPTRTNQIARVIPTLHWTFRSFLSSFLIGGMPFSTVCIEVYFIMGAIWLHQFYYLMGYLLAGFVLLGTTCALLSTVMCYIRLCAEDHRWWWKSFFDSASAGMWLFLYSLWYLCTRLHLVGLLPVVVYITYMAMVSVAFGLYCGSVGFLTSLWFTRTIYNAVKID